MASSQQQPQYHSLSHAQEHAAGDDDDNNNDLQSRAATISPVHSGLSPSSSTALFSRQPSGVFASSSQQDPWYAPAQEPTSMIDAPYNYSMDAYTYGVTYPTPTAKPDAGSGRVDGTEGMDLGNWQHVSKSDEVGANAQSYGSVNDTTATSSQQQQHDGYQFADSTAYDNERDARQYPEYHRPQRQDSQAGLLYYSQDSPGITAQDASAADVSQHQQQPHDQHTYYDPSVTAYTYPPEQHQHQQQAPPPPPRTRGRRSGPFSFLSRCWPCPHPQPRSWHWRWHSSWNMYLFFIFGLLCAVGHHVFYSVLDGRPAESDRQITMLRYGTVLAYAAKAGLGAAVIAAFRQRVWTTVRSRLMTVAAVDALFSATDDLVSLLNWDVVSGAKTAAGLAAFVWLSPLVVILTANTLLVEPHTITEQGRCPGIRTLNFTFEEVNEWRAPHRIDRLAELSLSIWNSTWPSGAPEPDGWFDYYTAPSPNWRQTATIGAYLEEVVARKNASLEICGAGWNCTYDVDFVAPGYKCTDGYLAEGIDAPAAELRQASGHATLPPFNTSILLPRGPFAYYVHATGGEYSNMQMKDVLPGGMPTAKPPWPKHFGAFRTEPVVWVGYAASTLPSDGKTKPPTERADPRWDEAFVPRLFACEHYETRYTARFNYTDGIQLTQILNRTFLAPVINTTFARGRDARDGTGDNTTALPQGNYVLPQDTRRYRRAAAFHSAGYMLRSLLNGTVSVGKDFDDVIQVTDAIQTKLLDKRNGYMPYPNLKDLVQGLYEDLILSLFSNPQFAAVAWAARPGEQSGTVATGGGRAVDDMDRGGDDYGYGCVRTRTANMYSYHRRDLWIVYGIGVMFALACVVAGRWAMHQNGGVVMDTKFSSIVAATRGPALERLDWRVGGGGKGVMGQRVGYGVLTGGEDRLSGVERVDWKSVGGGGGDEAGSVREMEGGRERVGFGLEGDVRFLPSKEFSFRGNRMG